MPKYKYMTTTDNTGHIIERNDQVWAFVPNEEGIREMRICVVTGINRATIKVEDEDGYAFTIGKRYYGKQLKANEVLLTAEDFDNMMGELKQLREFQEEIIENQPPL